MANDLNDEDLANEITARADITAENARSCPQLIGLGQILSIEDEAGRREHLRIYLRQYRSELIAELSALGIELQWPGTADPGPESNSLEINETDEDVDDAEEFITAMAEEIDDKETFAASNRRRAYINSTF